MAGKENTKITEEEEFRVWGLGCHYLVATDPFASCANQPVSLPPALRVRPNRRFRNTCSSLQVAEFWRAPVQIQRLWEDDLVGGGRQLRTRRSRWRRSSRRRPRTLWPRYPRKPRPRTRNLRPEASNPRPETRDPKPETRDPKPQTPNPKNPKPETMNLKPETRALENPRTRKPKC